MSSKDDLDLNLGDADQEDVSAMKQRLLNNLDIAGNEKIRVVCKMLVHLERTVRQAAIERNEHDDVDADLDSLPPEEERVDALAHWIAAGFKGEQAEWSLEEIYCDHVVGAARPDRAATYTDLGDEEWDAQISRWARAIRRRKDDVEDVDDRELVAEYVRDSFGLDLDTFEERIVEQDREGMTLALLGGPSYQTAAALRAPLDEEDDV